MIEALQGENYTWRMADSCAAVTHFALAPSIVLQQAGQWCAIWLLEDESPETKPFTIVGRPPHIVRQKLDLRYTYRDFKAASHIADDILQRILTRPEADDKSRTERELAVITALRKGRVSSAAIKSIFAEQPIGDPYHDTGSLIGSLTMVDELVMDVVQHYKTANFRCKRAGDILWFNLASVLRWWYPKRREDGLRILPEQEMQKLLRSQEETYILDCSYKRDKEVSWWMYGIDLEEAKRLGVIRNEQAQEDERDNSR